MIPIIIDALGTITETTNKDLQKRKLQQQRDALQMTNVHFRVVATGKQPLQPVGVLANRQGDQQPAVITGQHMVKLVVA